MAKPTAHTVIKLTEAMDIQVRHMATKHIRTEDLPTAHMVIRLMVAMATQAARMATKHIQIKVVPAVHTVTGLTLTAHASFI